MIQKFVVENFGSIKEKLEISFQASSLSDETYYQNVFKFKNSNFLKLVAFYGMNASGKSTIIRAFAALKELIIPLPIGPVTPYLPFEFSNETKSAPISLGIEFSPSNDEDAFAYKYLVTYDAKKIIYEKLEKMTSQKPSLIFSRTTNEKMDSELTIGASASNHPLLQALKSSIVPNRTFLSMFATFKVADLFETYQFFATRLINISPEMNRFVDVVPTNLMNDESLKKFTIKLLQAAGFNIHNIHVEKKPKTHVIANIPGFINETNALFLDHDGGSLEFIKESLGTRKIIILAEHLYPALSKPSVMIIDELESSLHPELTKLILTCFLDETINPHYSQLIFSSHETTLLDLDLLRRDQIYFVYKDQKTCGTYIKSLKDFQVRKTESIEKSYLAGRYLTSPSIDEILVMSESENDEKTNS